LKNLLF